MGELDGLGRQGKGASAEDGMLAWRGRNNRTISGAASNELAVVFALLLRPLVDSCQKSRLNE